MTKGNIQTNKSDNRREIAFLVPAYNEEAVIGDTLEALLKITSMDNIFVINDGSRDATSAVAKTYTAHSMTIPNGGKSNAINRGIEIFDLVKKYKYIMPVDADTVLTKNLPEVVSKIFNEDKGREIAAVICKVRGRATNALTSFRMWEYEISQIIHKSAQGIIDAIIVCPGCSTIYRSELFETIKFPSRTLTEDMDLTFTIHRKHLGKIVFTQKAEVITQDPKNLKEYIKQMNRWYTGFWMCLMLHKVPWGGQPLDLEVAMLATEGVFNGLLSLFFMIAVPIALATNSQILIYPIVFDLVVFSVPTLLYMAIRYKIPKIFLYLPFFYLLRQLNSLMFFKSFLLATIGIRHKSKFVWDTARYAIGKEAQWATLSQ